MMFNKEHKMSIRRKIPVDGVPSTHLLPTYEKNVRRMRDFKVIYTFFFSFLGMYQTAKYFPSLSNHGFYLSET